MKSVSKELVKNLGCAKSAKPTYLAHFFGVPVGYSQKTHRLDMIKVKIGYIRVSTQEQNTIRQEILMKELGVDEIYIDKISGKNTQRPELKAMLEYVRRGDTVIVTEISRFARNTRDLLDLVETLTAKGVEFVSKKEAIDTTTPTGKFMLTVFGAVAELEREYILQRQKEGIAAAKEQGKYTGRKRNEYTNLDRVLEKWRGGKITATAAMKELGMSRSTFYRRVREEAKRASS